MIALDDLVPQGGGVWCDATSLALGPKIHQKIIRDEEAGTLISRETMGDERAVAHNHSFGLSGLAGRSIYLLPPRA